MKIEKILMWCAIVFVAVLISMLVLDVVAQLYWDSQYKLCDSSQIMVNNASKIIQSGSMIYFYCKR